VKRADTSGKKFDGTRGIGREGWAIVGDRLLDLASMAAGLMRSARAGNFFTYCQQ